MSARAIWKGVVRFADVRVPVKLHSAVEDRSVHFRLLHSKDQVPVRQAMVNPDTDEVVPREEIRKAFVTADGDLVVLAEEELERIQPKASRDIHILQFLPERAIDHRWYIRPYWLSPDAGAEDAYSALAAAMDQSGREGLARWVMRKKEYVGALRLVEGYPMLITVRHAGQVVSAEELEAPEGPSLASKELDMARRLMDMMKDDFDPTEYRDEYRARVHEMIEKKARGGRVKKRKAATKRPTPDLAGALEASLQEERKRA
jgi:DNA end-binding protein Ku